MKLNQKKMKNEYSVITVVIQILEKSKILFITLTSLIILQQSSLQYSTYSILMYFSFRFTSIPWKCFNHFLTACFWNSFHQIKKKKKQLRNYKENVRQTFEIHKHGEIQAEIFLVELLNVSCNFCSSSPSFLFFFFITFFFFFL